MEWTDQEEHQWKAVENAFEAAIGKPAKDLNGYLFVIGVQELGRGAERFTKEEKQDLMHIAVCTLLSKSGYYELEKRDEDGWPHFKLLKAIDHQKLIGQERLLKQHIIWYFEEQGLI